MHAHGQQSKVLIRASCRYVDTSILINSFLLYPLVGPGSGDATTSEQKDPRGALAIARMNVLHSNYRISNDDYLYTLSTFIVEPPKWARLYEWRALTPIEEQAFFIFFKEIGRRMGIQDIPDTLPELHAWAEDYEVQHMLPNETCAEVAAATTELLLASVPRFFKPFGQQVVAALMYDRLRQSVLCVSFRVGPDR